MKWPFVVYYHTDIIALKLYYNCVHFSNLSKPSATVTALITYTALSPPFVGHFSEQSTLVQNMKQHPEMF